MTITDDWYGLYRAGWKNLIVDDAFQHPAKFARNLIKQIYDHCLVCHWLETGDRVVDPFGGVALGGLDAMRLGLNWIGVELEPKFVDLGNRNIALWNQRYGDKFMRWGTARLLQGDSRRLLEVVAGVDACVSSPPFHRSGTADHKGQTDALKNGKLKGGGDGFLNHYEYALSGVDGQLASLREGDLAAAISSPPFGDQESVQDTGWFEKHRAEIGRNPKASGGTPGHYGITPGNLGNLRADDDGFAAAVSSPPAADSLAGRGKDELTKSKGLGQDYDERLQYDRRGFLMGKEEYQEYANSCNLGSFRDTTDTFWSAARVIVAQTFAALRPGGHAVWTLKAFVRDGKRVEFPDQWRQLCESVGFVTLHVHRAWLVEDHGAQLAMDGNHKQNRKERKSFFRRLSEAKAQAAVYWPQLDRASQARYLWESHNDLWDDYNRRVLEPFEADVNPPVPATPSRIRSAARLAAWMDAGRPPMDIETRIDYETIICMEKPGA